MARPRRLLPSRGRVAAARFTLDRGRVAYEDEALRHARCGEGAAALNEGGTDGFLSRYRPRNDDLDGLPPGEGAFLPCSFWLVQALALMGHTDEATAQFEKLLALRNDVGLLSEEYDPVGKRFLGNIPQAFSHTALVNSALQLGASSTPSRHRHS